ncbi:hypothetical protein QRC92_000135 [Vibrio parahaemolyticus]|uniref:hypothetical protein n=1 Tax=Vibrio TaxID=662 RepID=UPI0004A21A2A|nr:hypothetical protein [Vibrio parahaemolyticus]KIT28923.1 hypothetical protein H323_22405 [Vibrio parahaemolyticus VP766]EGR2769660.1 hypothetical protein [Vibrio parahaemolyticus]EGR2834148.1 hypothetical protein [Vibrio parahaemolyticus]EGR2888617.1 hypothetical protein [Vibrio parahaemolyticus]EGR2907122.1 hypothetical protein [Vibrio parahaemolyticus]
MSLYESSPPALKQSFVCHVDMLGYSQLCENAIKSDSSNEFLNRIRTALNNAYERVRERSRTFSERNLFEIKIFTDNIVVGYPVTSFEQTQGEGELGHIFDVFSEFQLGLAMEGFLVRGGIAFGQHYMDDEIVFGDALIEAVKQDKNGGAPKVSLAPTAVQVLRRHLGFYSDPDWAPQSYDLLQDTDGSVFINYLQGAFVAFPEGGIYFDVFKKHKETVVAGLSEYCGIPSVRAKYEWAARYHNSVIDNFLVHNPIPTSPDADELYAAAAVEAQRLINYKIDIESYAAVPRKLSLVPIPPQPRT